MRTAKNQATLVAEVTQVGQVIPKVVAALPKDLDPKGFHAESQRLDASIATVKRLNVELKGAIGEKRGHEKAMRQLLKRVRAAVKGHFGDDSTEYALVGGTRLSERKKPVRKPRQTKAA